MKKILFATLFVFLLSIASAFAVVNCTLQSDYPYTSSYSPVNASGDFSCSGITNLTKANFTCAPTQVFFIAAVNATTANFHFNLSLVGNTTRACLFTVNDTTVSQFNTILGALYIPTTAPAFQLNSCPSTTTDVFLFIGVLSFILIMIVLSLVFKLQILGTMAAIGINYYAFLLFSCSAPIGMIFGGIGTIAIIYFIFEP